jgi:hypothetical protein
VSEKGKGSGDINNAHYNPKFGRTICEVHREMYDILFEDLTSDRREEVLRRLEEAYGMAKKMDAKLRQYKNDYDDSWWEKERESVIEEKLRIREERETKK